MILVRDVFRLKFGKTREAVATWKEMHAVATKAGFDPGSVRTLTDLVGPYYTFVMESTAESLAAWEAQSEKIMKDEAWRRVYQQFTPLVESGYREVFTIVK
jgi:hypothetical protein